MNAGEKCSILFNWMTTPLEIGIRWAVGYEREYLGGLTRSSLQDHEGHHQQKRSGARSSLVPKSEGVASEPGAGDLFEGDAKSER